MTDDTATMLRAIPVLSGTPPPDGQWAGDPESQFLNWLYAALESNVPEPHVAVLSTVDDVTPDARALILKDVDSRGWAFAGLASSVKGRQLAVRPVAALTFWWQPVVGSVRVRGPVIPASAEESQADLAARGAQARADVDPDDWSLWRLVPEHVEFWQGAADRKHLRVSYRRRADSWELTATRGGAASPLPR